jgi:hypothetical protein
MPEISEHAPAPSAAASEKPAPRKRMSEMLAEQIAQNPEIIAMDEPSPGASANADADAAPAVAQSAAQAPVAAVIEAPAPAENAAAIAVPDTSAEALNHETSTDLQARMSDTAPIAPPPAFAADAVIDGVPVETSLPAPEAPAAQATPEAAPEKQAASDDADVKEERGPFAFLGDFARNVKTAVAGDDAADQKAAEAKPAAAMQAQEKTAKAEPVKRAAPDEEFLAWAEPAAGEAAPVPADESLADVASVEIKAETLNAPAPLATPSPEEHVEEIAEAKIEEALPEDTKVAEEALSVPAKAEVKITKESARVEADLTQLGMTEPASGGTQASDSFVKLAALEEKLARLEKENLALNNELNASLRESEKERLDISSNNWDLERATMKYNEAERQIQRLGEQIQKERAQCSMQKDEMEAQLFDPQITAQQQLAKLASLEQQLAAAEQKLDDQRMRYEERIRMLESQRTTQ